MDLGRGCEVRVHGRGGQGTVTLAALLVDAAFTSGWHVLGFPAFGTERTGAPVAAFVRLSRDPVWDRGEVLHPSIVVVQDPSLIGVVDVTAGLTPGGMIVLNAVEHPADLGATVLTVAGTAIALEHLGHPITSTAMLGAFAGATDVVSIESVTSAIRARFRGDVATRNEAAALAGYDAARGRREAA